MDLNLSAWIRRRRRDIGPYALHIINSTGEYEGRIRSLELDLAVEKRRSQNMHRRAQKAEGRLSRIMEILELSERWFHRYGEKNKITPAMIPRFYVLEAIKRARRK